MIIDLLSLAAGSLCTLAGGILGYLARPRRRPPDPETCGCTHHRAIHDPETNECHGTIETQLYDVFNNKSGIEQRQCPCRCYTGLRPIDLDLDGLWPNTGHPLRRLDGETRP